MALANYLKVVRVLERSEEIKSTLSYCRSRDNCQCRAGELCQRALALATGLSDNAIKNMILRLERQGLEEGEIPLRVRSISGGGNYPRKFVSLRRD